MEGQHRRICRYAVGMVYPNKIANNVSSDFVFRKYKQNSAFCVSGVLQLSKTGPLVTKNFSILRLFPSDAMMAWRLYIPYDVNRTNLHILTAHGMFDSNWPTLKLEKKFVHASPKPKLENCESVQHRLQFCGIKKGAKISFHRHFKKKWNMIYYLMF